MDDEVRRGRSPPQRRFSLILTCRALRYETGTVIVSDTVEFSKSVSVAVVKCTSVTVPVHIGVGHEPAGAVGAAVETLKRNWPFRGVSWSPVLPAPSKLKL
jgi:hypothetical protein